MIGQNDIQFNLNGDEVVTEKKVHYWDTTIRRINPTKVLIDYVIIKIGNQVFSTHGIVSGKNGSANIYVSEISVTQTVGVGKQKHLMLRGVLTETNNHEQIEPIRFEIDVYEKMAKKDWEEKEDV